MRKDELRGWSLALAIARLEHAGGEFDYETGEITPPKRPTGDRAE